MSKEFYIMTHYHFVGIKGSGMSSLAQIMHDLGHEVQGSDIENYVFTEVALRNKGIKILPFDANNIKEDMVVIQGNAFASSHEEIVRAHQLKLDVVSYNDFLGQIIDQYTSVAVTGAHGKTSTTGLLSHVMNGDKKTSFLIGDGTGMGLPESDYFAFEACEYRRHFLSYKPDYAIMTNIDFDHPDYFKDINDVFDAFQEMAHNVKKGIIDYAHHPREISATIETARKKYPHKEVVAVFQPHTFSRTQAFLNEFAESLSKADRVFLCEIFGSIRENTGALTIQDLIDKIEGASLINEDSINVLEQFDNAVVLFMGAGDIQKLQNAYLDKLGMKNAF